MTQTITLQQFPVEKRERQTAEALVRNLLMQFGEQIVVVILFGSRARGDAIDESDMDCLILMSEVDAETRRRIRFLATEIWLEHGIFLSTSILSLAHWQELQKLKTALYRNIRDDGIILFQRPDVGELLT